MDAIDTNIIVYAFDNKYQQKRAVCSKIIADIFEGRRVGVVTNQILAEFIFVATKKIENPISKKDAQIIVGAILASENWKILDYTCDTVLNSLNSENISFWDSLIIQTLKEHNIQSIITENTADFSNSGLKVHNPFS